MTSRAVATTIWKQISVGAKMSVGAREPTATSDTELRFKVGRGRHWVLVNLDTGKDTYTVRYVKQKNAPSYEVVTLKTFDDIYAENLSELLVEICNE